MKNIITYLLATLLFLPGSGVLGQVIVIDLKTGIVNNTANTLITPGMDDDTWYVNTPADPPNSYHQVRCGAGQMPANNTYPPPTSPYPQVGWISPYLDNVGQPLANIPAGTCYYRMTFNLSSCPVVGSIFETGPWVANDNLVSIKINGNTSFCSGGGPYIGFTCGDFVNPGIIQGQNTVEIEVTNTEAWAGLQFNGRLVLKTCASAEMTIEDEQGNEKGTFCIDEEVFLNTSGSVPPGYQLELLEETSAGVYSLVAMTGNLPGSPDGLNVKRFFEDQFTYVFLPGNYKVKVYLNGPCGAFHIAKDFSFNCCSDSPDASFSLEKNGSQLTGKSTVSGTHIWTVYKASPVNGSLLTGGTSSGYEPHFSYNQEASCYYVLHTITNSCGSNCTSRRFCEFDCEEKDCNIGTPGIPQFNSGTKLLSWNTVSGAYGYVIQIIKNGCCQTGGTSSDVSTVDVQDDTPYLLDLFSDPGGSDVPAQCFLVTVYAKCPDGSLSAGSSTLCIYP